MQEFDRAVLVRPDQNEACQLLRDGGNASFALLSKRCFHRHQSGRSFSKKPASELMESHADEEGFSSFLPVYHCTNFLLSCVSFWMDRQLTEANGSAKRLLYPSVPKIGLPSMPLCYMPPECARLCCYACEPTVVGSWYSFKKSYA